MLKDELVFSWFALSSIQGIGSISLNSIREKLPNHSDLINCTAKDLILFGLKPKLAYKWAETKTLKTTTNPFILSGWQKIQHWCQQPNCGLLMPDDAFYPPSLMALRDAPMFLFYQGNPTLLAQNSIAIVGSRNPTHYGREQAFTIAKSLVLSNIHVVSGLAIGIDGEAHKGAITQAKGMSSIENNIGIPVGNTIAVLGSGLREIYPKRHKVLAENIVNSGGLLISEYMPDEKALAQNFPRRNRIVSGMSLGTLVIEAALKSGSLITARLAAEQGREVFALPGAVVNPLSRGCHQLIKDGASLIECADDILSLLHTELALNQKTDIASQQNELFDVSDGIKTRPEPFVNNERVNLEKKIYEALDVIPTAIETLVQRTGLSVIDISQQLILMELKGHVCQVPGGYVRA